MAMPNVIEPALLDELETGKGYCLGLFFQEYELNVVRSLIRSHWLDNIKQYAPTQLEKFSELDITRYHELSHLVDHSSILSKINRILPKNAIDFIRSTSLIKKLENIY